MRKALVIDKDNGCVLKNFMEVMKGDTFCMIEPDGEIVKVEGKEFFTATRNGYLNDEYIPTISHDWAVE